MAVSTRPALQAPPDMQHTHQPDEFPLWKPRNNRSRPPPLPCELNSQKGLTSKTYKTLSQLKAIERHGGDSMAIKPLLPMDLPIVQRLLATGPPSDSDDVVTSRVGSAARIRLPAETQTDDENADLETLLEETLEEAALEDVRSPSKRLKTHCTAPPFSDAVTAALQPLERKSKPLQVPSIDISTDPGTGTVAERAKHMALTSLGFAHWDALVQSVGGQPVSVTKGKGRRKDGCLKLADVLNPNSPFHHAPFAAAYRRARELLARDAASKRKAAALEDHSALVLRWSSLTPEEHTWYLKHEGLPRVSADEERFALLHAKVEAERQGYWAAIHAIAAQLRDRYERGTERQRAQLLSDRDVRRQRVTALPRWYKAVEPPIPRSLQGVQPGVQNERFPHLLRCLRRKGQPASISPISTGTSLPGHKLYLPAIVAEGEGRTGGDDGVYQKVPVPEPWNDPEMQSALADISHDTIGEVVVGAAAGAVSCLLSSGMLQNTMSWAIPLRVVEESTGSQRHVFLGKPLMPIKEPMRAKQRRLQKYAVLSTAMNEFPTLLREATYSLYTAGGIPLVVRNHARMLIQDSLAPSESSKGPTNAVPAVLAVTTEYLPEPDVEEDTAEELVSWWCKLHLTPETDKVAVAHVHVPQSKVVQWRTMAAADIEVLWGAIDPGNGMRTLLAVVQGIQKLCPGNYILVHKKEDLHACTIWKALDPLASGVEKEEGITDMHSTYADAGAIDMAADVFVPPRWRPYSEDVAQVPYTFPPQVAGHGGGKRVRGPRRRLRGVAWQGDMDQVKHVATISRAEYEAGLAEAL